MYAISPKEDLTESQVGSMLSSVYLAATLDNNVNVTMSGMFSGFLSVCTLAQSISQIYLQLRRYLEIVIEVHILQLYVF